jgi:predicted permease
MALTTIAVFALVPAWRTTSVDPTGALRGAARGYTDSRGQMRARAALVSTEIALAITLLAGAGLLIDSLRRLADVDTGIESLQEVLTAQFSIDTLALKPGMDLDTWAANAMQQLGPRLAAIENRLGEIPNVDSVALSFGLPASGIADWSSGFRVVGQPDLHESVQYRFVSRDYFRTFGIPVEAGRAFNALDGTRALLPTEMLVNRAFADRYLAGRDPLASEIRTFGDAPIPVIGVVGDVRQAGLDHAAHPEVYFPVSKALKGELSIALKVQGDAMRFAEPLRRAMHEVAPDAPVYEVRTMDSVVGATLALRRFNVTLMGIFAALALVLAATGLYGVVAYAVGARRREIGLRQALGANASAIGRLVLRTGMAMIVPGIIVGLLGALALGRVIAAQLYGVGAHDPLVLGAVVLFLSLAAFAACAIPTLRATRIAPMEVLRNE